jgi:hypothetical protein
MDMNMDLWIAQRNIERCDQLLLAERDEGKRTEVKRQQALAWRRVAELTSNQESQLVSLLSRGLALPS